MKRMAINSTCGGPPFGSKHETKKRSNVIVSTANMRGADSAGNTSPRCDSAELDVEALDRFPFPTLYDVI
jgi:hypothetical protein